MNPIKTVTAAGHAVWLDYLRRGLLDGDGLGRMTQRRAKSDWRGRWKGHSSNPV